MTFTDRSEAAMTALLDSVAEKIAEGMPGEPLSSWEPYHKYVFKQNLLPVVTACIDALDEEKAGVWDEGFSFAFWQERGYTTAEAQAKGLPDHLRDSVGLEPLPDYQDQVWNPYRKAES
jgi:hypothetical protein